MVIVVYDIPDNKRRTKLAHFLEGYGSRVQWSVFELFITVDEMRVLHQKVKKLVVPTEDNVRFYWISDELRAFVLTIGSLQPEPPPGFYMG